MADVIDNLKQVPDTLSSWDKCMAKTYCKWPVIVVIIIGALIALSLIWCLARCLCCGAECACCCFRCCAGCCGSGRRSGGDGHKRMPSNPAPSNPYSAQYRSHPAPSYAPAPAQSPYNVHNAFHTPETPQYARFEGGAKPLNEDALPAMPSWKDAKSTRVEDDSPQGEDVEMKPLSPAPAPVATPGGRSPVQQQSPHAEEYGYAGGMQSQQQQNPYGGGYHMAPYRSNNSFRHEMPGGRSPGSPNYGGAQNEYYGQNQNYGNAAHDVQYNNGYQESGVSYDQGYAGYTNNNNSHSTPRNQNYDHNPYEYNQPPNHQNPRSDPYARQPSPNYTSNQPYENSTTPYPEDNRGGYGYQPQPVQPVQQAGYHTRRPVDGTWKEV